MQGKCFRYEAEYRIRNRDGHYLWVHDRGRVCDHDADGQPRRVVGMVQDISARKTLELQLQELASSDMLTGLGATVTEVTERFQPMRGAYHAHGGGHSNHNHDHA